MKRTRASSGRNTQARTASGSTTAAVIGAIGLILILLFAATRTAFLFGARNGDFLFARYTFTHEDFRHPRLQQLRKREGLDRVIAGGSTQFLKTVLLRKWTRAQWRPGDRFHYPPWDAVEILDLARRHDNRGFCAQYAIVFLQACLSVGIPARYVDLPGHFVTGVWSDEYGKWVIMDPYNDIHFERNGIPLNGRELCEAYWRGRLGDIEKASSGGTREAVTKEDLALYRMYSIVLRNNHLSEPVEVEENGARRILRVQPDHRSYPFVGRDRVNFGAVFLALRIPEAKESFQDKTESGDPDDFTFKENQTIMFYNGLKEGQDAARVILLRNDSPEFGAFLIKTDGGAWKESNNRVLWHLHAGINTLAARIRTREGWLGKESSLKILYKPRWIKLPQRTVP